MRLRKLSVKKNALLAYGDGVSIAGMCALMKHMYIQCCYRLNAIKMMSELNTNRQRF